MGDTPIKLLVMDLDGTLLPHGGVISERTIAAIRAARELGVITTISSGRNIPSFIEYARTVLGLVQQRAGTIEVFGQNLAGLSRDQHRALERRWGVLFQQGALFSSLTVRQNIQVPMREYLSLSQGLMDELSLLKIRMVGLNPDAADKFPSELSGGMIKRAALARALALDPEILFLDEPTSGLDPIGAAEFDTLIATLQKTLGLTVFMVTHDLDSLYSVCDRVAALADKKIIAAGTLPEILAVDHPWVQAYFHGERALRRGTASKVPAPLKAP